MNSKIAKRSSMFLLELIISILLFSLASAVCVKIYVASSLKSSESANLNSAVILSQNVAEITNFETENLDTVKTVYDNAFIDDTSAVIYFDKNWQNCNIDNALFALSIIRQKKDTFAVSHIKVIDQSTGALIYELSVKKHLQAKRN